MPCGQWESLVPLLYEEGEFTLETSVSIAKLRQKFEALGIQNKKATQLARYLLENAEPGSDIAFNENLTGSAPEALNKLQALLGQYFLYRTEEDPVDPDDDEQNIVQEKYMQKLIVENFGNNREALIESLKCEDYEEEGLLDLAQMQEAISSVNEEIEASLLDYMLFYVLKRSESHEACLLYTSPSPRDQRGSRMPSSA